MKGQKCIFSVLIVLLLPFCFTFSLFAQGLKDKPSDKVVNQKIKKLQIPFIANEGQTNEKVKFYANTFGGTVFVTKSGEIVYSLPDSKQIKSPENNHFDIKQHIPVTQCILSHYAIQTVSLEQNCLCKPSIKEKDHLIKGVILKEEIVGGKVNNIQGKEKSITKVNYFRGNDKKNWKNNISTYDVVDLGEVYRGIELKLKAYGNNVEKLFYVKPEINPAVIQLKLSGSQNLTVNENGELEAETESGTVKFTKPIAYQEIEGKKIYVASNYKLLKQSKSDLNTSLIYGFDIGKYDKTKELVIDPLLASTYLGGLYDELGYAIALDSSGNVYVTGSTDSSDFPTTSGAYDTSLNNASGHDYDVFVAKLDSSLTSLQASTYLGGLYDELGFAIALDSSGNVYVTGRTDSRNFPTTNGAYDTSYNGGNSDVFVSKLDSSLSVLQASTYLGGSNYEYGYAIALDGNGNVYVTGYTASNDFPTSSRAYDISNDSSDAFVSKLNSSLSVLQASTYLGGSDSDFGYAIALDGSGNVYVTGSTRSSDFPTTSGAYDTSHNGGNSDVFVSKLNSSLSVLQASTYLGGSGSDDGKAIALDSSGNVYVTGYTYSKKFPTTSGAYNTSHNGGNSDVFVSKLNSSLSVLQASTYLGGSDADYGYAIALDSSGNVYVTGYTESSDFPTTSGAYDTSYYRNSDVFVSKLNNNLSASSIYGTVMDAEDNPIESAKVTCKGKNEKEKILTDENGYFESTELEKGTYKITVSKKGYKKWKQKVKLGKGEEKEIEVVLAEK